MKTILYIISVMYFLLPVGKPLAPAGTLLTDTIPVRDTIQEKKIEGSDTSHLFKDTIPTTDTDLLGDSLVPHGKAVKGVASYYSSKFEGRKTANGSTFKNAGMTAASNHFKLNTLVKVTNLRNNKSVIVLITDRMHNRMKKKGRVVDLTRNAAKQLDFIKRGLVKVSVQPVIPVSE